MNVHELKSWPIYFEAVWEGRKTAELRKDDRGFCEGDLIWLREWDPGPDNISAEHPARYTGRTVMLQITHVIHDTWGLSEGYAMLSFECVRIVPMSAAEVRLQGLVRNPNRAIAVPAVDESAK